jgi:hypothetical protein
MACNLNRRRINDWRALRRMDRFALNSPSETSRPHTAAGATTHRFQNDEHSHCKFEQDCASGRIPGQLVTIHPQAMPTVNVDVFWFIGMEIHDEILRDARTIKEKTSCLGGTENEVFQLILERTSSSLIPISSKNSMNCQPMSQNSICNVSNG